MQRETTSLISSHGGEKVNEPVFGQRTIINIIKDELCVYIRVIEETSIGKPLLDDMRN